LGLILFARNRIRAFFFFFSFNFGENPTADSCSVSVPEPVATGSEIRFSSDPASGSMSFDDRFFGSTDPFAEFLLASFFRLTDLSPVFAIFSPVFAIFAPVFAIFSPVFPIFSPSAFGFVFFGFGTGSFSSSFDSFGSSFCFSTGFFGFDGTTAKFFGRISTSSFLLPSSNFLSFDFKSGAGKSSKGIAKDVDKSVEHEFSSDQQSIEIVTLLSVSVVKGNFAPPKFCSELKISAPKFCSRLEIMDPNLFAFVASTKFSPSQNSPSRFSSGIL